VRAYVVGTRRPRWTLGGSDIGHASVEVTDCIASRTRQPSRDGPSALRTGAVRLRGADGGSGIGRRLSLAVLNLCVYHLNPYWRLSQKAVNLVFGRAFFWQNAIC
jgi:hypothetical protein